MSFSSFSLLISDWNAKHIRMLAISNSFDESCLTDEGRGRSEKYVIMKKFKIFVGKSVAFFRINAKFKLSRLSVSLWENRLS